MHSSAAWYAEAMLRAVCLVFFLGLVACSSNDEAAAPSGGSGGGAGDAGADTTAPPAPYTVDAFDKVRINSDSSKENFQHALTDVDFGAGPFEKVTLVVDLDTTCYPFDKWQDNPPPSGQNWPADCDAFDRNFEFYLDPAADPATDPPGIELVRAITPFGGPLHLDVDVTDVANGLPGKHALKVVIPTWSDGAGQVSGSDGGWFVSAHLDVVPGTAPRKVLAVKSLFNGSQTKPDPIAAIPFEVPEGTTSSRLEYRATGHGGVTGASGCGLSPAEEFCLRTHALFVDEKSFTDVMPWRDDCDTLCTIAHQGPANGGFDYCQENPCGAIASVKAPRANWCPGSVTPAYDFDVPELSTPGSHSFRFQIGEVADGGSWRISTTFFAFGE